MAPTMYGDMYTRNQDVSDPLAHFRERTPGALTSWLRL